MSRILVLLACVALAGCELDARRANMTLEQENEDLRRELRLATEYIEDVTLIIDQVQRNLQGIRDREGMIGKISLSSESNRVNAVNVRRDLENSITDIDRYIQENRRQMELLAQRVKESAVRIEGLEQMVANLNTAVKQKEEDVLRLKRNVAALEADLQSLQDQIVVKDEQLASNAETISQQQTELDQREQIIREQEVAASTGYFVVESRDELKRRGLIVEKKSGFLGLSKDTKVGTITESDFVAVSKEEPAIDLGTDLAKVEIVSAHRDRPDLYQLQRSEHGTHLAISDPKDFWALSEYLIIVASD